MACAGAWREPDTRQPSQTDFHDQVNAAFGLSSSTLATLPVITVPELPVNIAVPLDGQVFTLSMTPRSVRSPFYQVYAQVADGSLVPVPAGPVRTLRGSIAELGGSAAAGSMLDDGLHATVLLPDGGQYWIEPVFGRVPGAQPDQYVIYHRGDTLCAGVCGLNDANNHSLPQLHPMGDGDEGGIAGGVINCVQLACDADFEYYTFHGSNVATVEAQINSVNNTMNVQYENDVSLRHEITAIIVRTVEPDPYTSTDPSTLLSQFRNEWINNQGAIQRNLAELFTGKEIDGSVIGIAWGIGEVCTNGAYCLVQSDFSSNFACKTDLSAHEIGHLWGGTHCSCPTFTMNPSITCANVHAPGSITEITNYKNSVTCDTPCEDGTTTLPFFDDFPTTTINAALWTGIDGATINTLGLAEPSAPNSLNLDGSTNGGDELRTAIINTTGVSNLKVEYDYERRGGGDSPETNDDLVVEYVNSSGQWVEANRQLGSGADMTTFAFVSVPLPADALHANFRLRFRVISAQNGLDDWFVDNVLIDGLVPPPNDSCSSMTTITIGSTPFTTLGATSVGPDDTVNCNFNGSSQIGSDVWFRYVSLCNQQLTISVCNANFDTKMAVYSNFCPTLPNQSIACNDNSCGTGSAVSFPAQSFQVYLIRLGGVGAAQGTGTLVLTCTAAPPTGSCCLPGSGCVDDLTEAQCAGLNGTYQGDGFQCGGVPCEPPTGACCLPDGSCSNAQTAAQCAGAGGTYQGDSSTCAGANCPQPTGACCLPDGSCTNAQTAAQCASAGGTYQGNGSTCATATCPQPTGACCLPDGSCSNAQTAVQCAAAKGTYQGNGSTCAGANCPQPLGACCFPDGSCSSSQTAAACISSGGTYQGDGTDCISANCPQPVGACCLPNGSCADSQTAAQCAAAKGAYQGDGITCAKSTCAQPCIPDIAPAGGNGSVDIDDLLTIINAWGPCPPPTPGSCPADIAPAGGNGSVDIDDLLAIINAWGPCP